MLRKIVLGLVSSGILLGSTAVAAMPIDARDAVPVAESEFAGMKGFAWLLGLALVAGVVAIIVSDTGEDDAPVSP